MIDKELLEILACPACKGSVRRDNDKVICQGCLRIYPINQGIPIMLIEEAQSYEKKEN